MPMRTELPVRTARMNNPPSALDRVASWIGATLNSPEFLMVALFCATGLWLTAYFIHYFPDFGAMAESIESFP
jgi:hypothetical protein